MKKVLWIEDSARFELSSLTGPVYFSGKYDFHLADDVTSALDSMQCKVFDVIIVDIRLPPGIDEDWRQLYERASAGVVEDQLGFRLLMWLLGHDSSLNGRTPPSWISADCIAVFTVESDPHLQEEVRSLGVLYFQKTAGSSDTILVDIIEAVLKNKARAKGLDSG